MKAAIRCRAATYPSAYELGALEDFEKNVAEPCGHREVATLGTGRVGQGRRVVSALPALVCLQAFRQLCDDLLPVESAVFDKDVAGPLSRGGAAGNEQVRHVGLERLHVQL